MRVYTNRDQVEVFHLTVEKQITEGCDKGQECIIVANLDTEGRTCSDQTCTSYLAQGTVPVYTVGNHMYVRILFKDNSYTKYLHVVTVKFIDDAGIYNYVRNIQWWTLRQGLGSTDVDILLFQPHVNALVEVSLKIALSQDALRNLAEKNEIDEVKQNFHVQVQSKPKKTETEKANFSSQLLCGLALSALTLIL
ncbi:hypothetical protein IMG5_132790 [Ichthyophthirius multifiliis]|uniref:Uncharacterized protein n=1 Tax=Ichthyophthirius multifiliis TaxID=5932 RepID=G0QWJ4_ICHMU|nr:hypothetical protein IMG5_132790 [Ichthyophthirius multifiliis]EGR30407.1 hypothetical protein IMG5_132790 [Ichthyophthirius multifiliis]|eukprot:XP_004031994.1 hypothetical protein IMG5_132790 [Ichthyophthirius multifiliis]